MTTTTTPVRIGYAEACTLTGISYATLRSAVRRKSVPHYRLSTKLVVFDRDELLAWMETRRVPAT